MEFPTLNISWINRPWLPVLLKEATRSAGYALVYTPGASPPLVMVGGILSRRYLDARVRRQSTKSDGWEGTHLAVDPQQERRHVGHRRPSGAHASARSQLSAALPRLSDHQPRRRLRDTPDHHRRGDLKERFRSPAPRYRRP